MLDPNQPFIASVKVTIPYLQSRSLGGAIMTLGHFVFAYHFVAMALRHGPSRTGAALLHVRTAGA